MLRSKDLRIGSGEDRGAHHLRENCRVLEITLGRGIWLWVKNRLTPQWITLINGSMD